MIPEDGKSEPVLTAKKTVALGFSEFCDLFTEEEWKGYEYANGEARCTSVNKRWG